MSPSTPPVAGSPLSNVHPQFAAACESHEAAPGSSHLTPTLPVDQPGGVTRRLVLASASPVRARVLREAGFAPEVIVSGADEDDVTGPTAEVARTLAERKAKAVAEQLAGPPAIVLGGDTVLDVDGETRGKAPSLEVARAWWASVARPIGHPPLRALRARHGDGPLRAAAWPPRSCTTDGRLSARWTPTSPLASRSRWPGASPSTATPRPFVDRIEGDHAAVLGLSLPLLRRLLADVGIEITDLWAPR